MRVLLVSAPHRDTFGYSMPPPGLLRLGGWLEREGFEVVLLDLAHELAAGRLPGDDGLCDAAADRMSALGRFDAIGMSVMGATLPAGLAILERIRARNRAVPLLLGGPGTTGVDAALVERVPCVDAVVRGEGEIATTELLRALSRGASAAGVAGVTWRDAHGRAVREPDRPPIADLDTLAPYAWHLLPPIAEYKRVTGGEDGLVPVDSGRGCVFDCSFCTIGRFWSRRSRVLPVVRLADEVCALRGIEGARAAYLCHDLFAAHRAHAVEFCREMLRRGAPVPFEVRARADHLDRELLELMAAAGCYRVLLGVESADPAVRDRCDKKLAADLDVLRVARDCVECGITPILSVILGLPGEGPREREASLDLCARAALTGGVNVSLHLVNPQPGCGLAEEFGADARAVEGVPPDMARGAGETAPERAWIARHPDLFTTFALLPGDAEELRALARLAAELPEVLHRYPRTFALLRRVLRLDAGGLHAAWKCAGRSFEAFARSARDPLVDDVLAVEQAAVRASALRDGIPSRGPRARGVRLAVRHDVPRAFEALRAGTELPRDEHPTILCVVPAGRARVAVGTRTLSVSPDAARLLAALDGTRTSAELEAAHPGISVAVARLAAAGLVDPGGPESGAVPPPHARTTGPAAAAAAPGARAP